MWKSRSGPCARKRLPRYPISEQSSFPWRSWGAVACDLRVVKCGGEIFSLAADPPLPFPIRLLWVAFPECRFGGSGRPIRGLLWGIGERSKARCLRHRVEG